MPNRNAKAGRARPGTTCIHCRRMKLRCDAPKQFPAPCSRCAKTKRECFFSERSPKSDRSEDPATRIALLERDLTDLRRDLERSPASGAAGRSPGLDVEHGDEDDELSAGQLAAELGCHLPTQPLGDVTMPWVDFLDLIDIFFADFHPQLPFLPGKRSLLRDCVACPLLYWAVTAVSCRASPAHQDLRIKLTWPVRRLAAATLVEPPTLPAVQGLLLLTMWPMPFSALVDDPSGTLIAAATSKGLQLGFNRPRDVLLQRVEGDTERVRATQMAWAACFIVGQEYVLMASKVNSRYGFSQSASFEQLQPPPNAPQVLLSALELTRKALTLSSLLSRDKLEGELPRGLVPVMKAFEVGLEEVEARMQDHVTPFLERLLCGIKLRLYSYALVDSCSRADGSTSHALEMANYVSKAYAVALHIIDFSLQSGGAQARPTSTWSVIDFQSFIIAAYTILHILRRHGASPSSSNHAATPSDDKEALDAIQRAWSMLRSCSLVEGDQFARTCYIIQYLVAMKTPPPSMATTTTTTGLQTDPLTSGSGAAAAIVTVGPGMGVVQDLVMLVRDKYRRGLKRFPERFPEHGLEKAPHGEAVQGTPEDDGIMNTDGGIDWTQDLFQGLSGVLPEFDGPWPGWYDTGELGRGSMFQSGYH